MSIIELVKEKTQELLKHHCYDGLKNAAEKWLKVVGTEEEKEAAKSYVAELEVSVMDIDTVIQVMDSEFGVKTFGAELANKFGSHAKEIKANGAIWCDCPACSIGLEILSHKEEILA